MPTVIPPVPPSCGMNARAATLLDRLERVRILKELFTPWLATFAGLPTGIFFWLDNMILPAGRLILSLGMA